MDSYSKNKEGKSMKPVFTGWMLTATFIVALLCGTALWLNAHPYAVRFEMDDNTRAAIESVNYSAISEARGPSGEIMDVSCGPGKHPQIKIDYAKRDKDIRCVPGVIE